MPLYYKKKQTVKSVQKLQSFKASLLAAPFGVHHDAREDILVEVFDERLARTRGRQRVRNARIPCAH